MQEKPNNSLTKKFNFDRVFGPKTSQEDVYKTVVGRLINEVTQGTVVFKKSVIVFSVHLFAYHPVTEEILAGARNGPCNRSYCKAGI